MYFLYTAIYGIFIWCIVFFCPSAVLDGNGIIHKFIFSTFYTKSIIFANLSFTSNYWFILIHSYSFILIFHDDDVKYLPVEVSLLSFVVFHVDWKCVSSWRRFKWIRSQQYGNNVSTEYSTRTAELLQPSLYWVVSKLHQFIVCTF